ncbi:hypothetical protein V6N13_089352 [Hibiscus sabdariffa]|uniref:Xyloglucan endo-transglycosylase C-terminal domain-containing protein n=2 Tax=Hibiscus sabdariffa TaxID=183260 RepID=A0ABR2NSK2_9ROSI
MDSASQQRLRWVHNNYMIYNYCTDAKRFPQDACVWSNRASSCKSNAPSSIEGAWFSKEMDSSSHQRLRWVRKNYMIYNYCNDAKRFPQGLPQECKMS